MTDHTVVERFRRVAAEQPRKAAIDTARFTLTYAELDRLSDRTAMALAARGVGPGHRVGLYFEREPRVLVALIGALKSGAGVVPLLSSFPVDRLRLIVESADVALALAPSAASVPADLGLTPVGLDECERHDDHRPLPTIDPDSLAAILFTSGTTGQSKGVPQSHRLMIRKIQRIGGLLQLHPADRVTGFSTPAMSQGFHSVLLTQISGATACPFDVRNEGTERLVAWLGSERVTVWYSSVSLLRMLARTVDANRQFPAVRLVRVGGERVLPGDIEAARRLFPSALIRVVYATTETGSICVYRVGETETFETGVVPVGTPVEDLTIHIVNEQGEALSAGEEGEIVVQSAHISSGYWHAPELSAARFADAPGYPGQYLYRTGDLGRRRPDGIFEHLGRKDLRVKIRGYRIEIEEIETVLAQQPLIVRAAVVAKAGAEGDPRLVAYVQPAPEAEITVEALRVELGRRLADYMIPSTFVFMDDIPLTASGKVARQQLPEPPPERPALDVEYEEPRNLREETIAAIWQEVLGLTRVGIRDGFFSVGGDSLRATLVASRLNARFGLSVPLSTLFEASTIVELADVIARLEAEPAPHLRGSVNCRATSLEEPV